MMKVIEKIHSLTAVVIACCILAAAAGLIGMEKQEFSESENRYLEGFPDMTWERIKSGAYMEDLSSYLSDHFPFRDFFMGLKTEVEIDLGRREINQVLIAEDGYRIETYQKPKNTEKIAGILHTFSEKLPEYEMSLMLIPTAVWVYQEKLPAFADTLNQMQTANQMYEMSGLQKIDCSQRLWDKRSENVPLFYKTDHHWTSYGAYEAYLAYCEAKGITPVPLEVMKKEEVTHDFRGTIYSKVNDYQMESDTITLFTNPQNELTVTYEDTGEVTDTLYNLEYLEKKDKYSLFLNNIHPLIQIENKTADSENVLVLIKDSYANSMVPFLVNHYAKIYVFDTRYYKMGPSSFIKEHSDVTDILLLYNLNTLDGDLGVRAIY